MPEGMYAGQGEPADLTYRNYWEHRQQEAEDERKTIRSKGI